MPNRSQYEALNALADSTVIPNPTVVGTVTTAPTVGVVLADTGALAAGVYRTEIALGFSGVVAAGKHIVVEVRDAANTSTLRTLAMCVAPGSLFVTRERVVIAANERIRAVNGIVGAAGEVAQASIAVSLLPTFPA